MPKTVRKISWQRTQLWGLYETQDASCISLGIVFGLVKRRASGVLRLLLIPVYKIVVGIFFLAFAFSIGVFCRLRVPRFGKESRLLWGTEPIINNAIWARILAESGWCSETFTTMFYSIHVREDWDRLLDEEFKIFPGNLRPYLGFLVSLLRYDVMFLSFRGLFIGETNLWRTQSFFIRLARKKVVVLPYGSDAYIYRRIRNIGTAHGLMTSYPAAARDQDRIAARVDYWVKHADIVISGFMGVDGIGRWDVGVPNPLSIDTLTWGATSRKNTSRGSGEPVVVAHTPNHRGVKGTEFVINAVDVLRQEGLRVELLLLEEVPNEQVRKHLSADVDILVEQVIYTYGLSAIEGMASGLPVITNLEDDDSLLHFRRWSYLGECPLVSASPENIVSVLRALVLNPELRKSLGNAGRKYVEKYHGSDSAKFLFENVIGSLQGEPIDLMGLYHPLTGDYPNRFPKIDHPLRNNRLPEELLW